MNAIAIVLALPLLAAPEFATFPASGYAVEAAGVWYLPGEVNSVFPIGGLGTGFIGLNSDGSFGEAVLDNDWRNPRPLPLASGFTLRAGDASIRLQDRPKLPDSARFWGHFPMADLEMADVLPGVTTSLRAFAPLIPHDYAASNMPAAFFKYTVVNTGTTPVPVEIALDWIPPDNERGLEARGNVETASAWHREFLQPGEVWKVAPMILFAPTREELDTSLAALPAAGDVLTASEAPEGAAYNTGLLTDFFLDRWGGFDWEDHHRQSAVFSGNPQISQLLWQVRHGDTSAGRSREGMFGLSGELPAKTEDGALAVEVSVRPAGELGLVLEYAFTNLSDVPLDDVSFGIAVNFDLGGSELYTKNTAAVDKGQGLVIVEQPGGIAAALTGGADAWYVGQWPAAHEALFGDSSIATAAESPLPTVQTAPGGIVWKGDSGSYALGASGDGWAVDARKAGTSSMQVRATRTLAPGESSETDFVIAWHFPEWRSSDGELLRHRYAERYAGAEAVLQAAQSAAASIEMGIIAWQEKIYGAQAPASLKDAVLNSLYILPRNSWWLADGRFFQSESFTGCPITETLVCRFNGTFPLALLWPECEQSTMAEFVRTQKDNGQIAFSFGSPEGSRTPNWDHQRPIVSTEFVLLAWRNYALWQDEAWLREIYPAMRAAMRYAMTLDTDGDLLVNEAPGSDDGFPANQYYDVWPWYGTSAYTGSICLAAWKALEEAAYVVGDYRFAEEAAVSFQQAAAAFDTLLWTSEYYRLYMDPAGKRKSDTSLTNALCGQWFAYASGLGALFPEERIGSVIDTVLRLNDPASAYGAVNGVQPDGSIDQTYAAHSAALTIGEVWNFCAMAAFAGKKDEALRLFEESYGNIALRQQAPWNIPWSYNPETGAIQWGIHYYSNPCVWTLFQALAPAVYTQLGPETEKAASEATVLVETDAT